MTGPTTTSAEPTAARAREILREIGGILERERGTNWLPGIRAALSALEPRPGDTPEDARAGLVDAASIYRAMNRGPGSFGDLYIVRADPNQQADENYHYGKLADELWQLLGDVR